MAKFYIVDTGEGSISTTDDEDIARFYQMSEDSYIIDSMNNLWLTENGDKEIPNTHSMYKLP